MNSDNLDNALQAALSGNAILFLGAGVGSESKNDLNSNIPNGGQLATLLAKELGVSDSYGDLTRIAQYYRRKKGAHQLKSFLDKNLTISETSQKLQDLLSLPWKRIYTTNYDNLLSLHRPKFTNFSHTQIPRGVRDGDHIYINGHLAIATLHTLDTELVLTDWSYANSSFPESQWAGFMRQDIANCGAMIFIGYSMRDLDITRIIISEKSQKSKTVIVTAADANEIDIEILSHYGAVYPSGIDYVYARRKQVGKSFKKPDDSYLFTSLQKFEPVSRSETDQDRMSQALYEQLIYGSIDQISLFDRSDVVRPLIRRESLEGPLESLVNGNTTDLVLTGGIGAGKTFACLDIAEKLNEHSYKVFSAIDRRNIHDDIIQAAKYEKVAFIFDNYNRYLPELETLSHVRQPGHVAVFSARTSLHELFETKINSASKGHIQVVDLEKLSYSDLTHLDTLLNFSGLWNEFAGWKPERRVQFSQATLASSMSRILIRAAQSSDILSRIKREILPVLEDPEVSDFFVASLILNVLQYHFWIADWQNFFGTRKISSALEHHRSALMHFVNINTSSITARAGLIATEILNNIVDPTTKIRSLEKIYKSAMAFSNSDDEMRHLVIDLMKYSNIESFFVEGPEKLISLKSYYHKIRNYGDTANRSDYWLQFGIALSIHGNLESNHDLNECKVAFKNAFEREKARREPNLRRIENYFSRFQLQMAVVERSADEAFKLFWNGSLKLINQIFDEETRHYPFKAGKLFSDIAAIHFRNWDNEKKGRFVQRCNEMLQLADERNERARHRDVQFLSSELRRLVDTISSNGQ